MFRLNIIYLPQQLAIGYLIITFVMYLISPWGWPANNKLLMIIYNIIIWLSIYWGYHLGIKKNISPRRIIPVKIYQTKFFNRILWLGILMIYPNFSIRLNEIGISISEIYDRIVFASSNIALAYTGKAETSELNSLTHPLVLFYTLSMPFVYFVKIVAIYYWKCITNKQKILLLSIIVGDILAHVAIGTNKGIFDYVLILPFIFILVKSTSQVIKYQIKLSYKFVVTIVILLFLGFVYFSNTYSDRTKDYASYSDSTTDKAVNFNSFIMQAIPNEFKIGYLGLDYYLTHSYNALDMAFDMDFVPCYGLGNSNFLMGIANKIDGLGQEIKDNTYEERMEKQFGWQNGLKWHTFYVSLANDVSFLGVPFIIFLFSFYFSLSWKDLLVNGNIKALPVFTQFIIMFFYLNANNQILGNTNFVTFVLLFLYWKKSRTTYLL